MDDMDEVEEVTCSRERYAVLYVLCGFVLSVTVMFGLYIATKFPMFLLAAVIQLLPMLLNLILLLPKGHMQEKIVVQDDDEPPTKPERLQISFRNALISFGNWYARNQVKLSVGFITAVTVAVNICFWMVAAKGHTEPAFSYAVPVILIGILVVFIVLDKLCKRTEENDEPVPEDTKAKAAYDRALLRGLHNALRLSNVSVILLTAVSILSIMGFNVVIRYFCWAIQILFGYETICLMFAMVVRLIRHEFRTAPELTIPMPGKVNGDLNVISYLEQNTGMTMRSLWSIKLMKQIVPYAVMGIALLLWLFSGVVKIDAHQQGAFYRLGRLQPEPLKPGLHVTLPWPFDSVDVYDTETINKLTVGYTSASNEDNTWTEGHGGEEYKLLLGGGKELVSINLRVEYKIDDLLAYVSSSASPEKLLQAAAYETITNKTISTDLETLLASDRQALAASVQEELMQRMQRYDMGLSVVSVVLESIHPPVEIAQVYQMIVNAGIDAQRIILEAENDAAVRVANARRGYNDIMSGARVDYHKSVAKANSEVSAFMASVEADKSYGDQFRYYKYLEALSESYSNGKLVIVGEGIDEGNIFIGKFTGKADGGK